MQNAEAICCKVRIKTISVQLKLELGLSLAIKTSMFFDEVVSKLIRFGLVSLLNLGLTCGAGKVLFRISLRLYAFC